MSAIEQSKASAKAAFRAGRKAGLVEAMQILGEMMDQPGISIDRKRGFCEAFERVSSASKAGEE